MSEKREYTLHLLQDQSGRTASVRVKQGGKAVTPPPPEPPKPVDKSVYWTERDGKIYAYVKDPHALDDLGGSVELYLELSATYRLSSVGSAVSQTVPDSVIQSTTKSPRVITSSATKDNPVELGTISDEDSYLPESYRDDSYDITGGSDAGMVYYDRESFNDPVVKTRDNNISINITKE